MEAFLYIVDSQRNMRVLSFRIDQQTGFSAKKRMSVLGHLGEIIPSKRHDDHAIPAVWQSHATEIAVSTHRFHTMARQKRGKKAAWVEFENRKATGDSLLCE